MHPILDELHLYFLNLIFIYCLLQKRQTDERKKWILEESSLLKSTKKSVNFEDNMYVSTIFTSLEMFPHKDKSIR